MLILVRSFSYTPDAGVNEVVLQSCQRCKYTTSVDIQKRAIKSIHSCKITCERSESARERRIALYKSDS